MRKVTCCAVRGRRPTLLSSIEVYRASVAAVSKTAAEDVAPPLQMTRLSRGGFGGRQRAVGCRFEGYLAKRHGSEVSHAPVYLRRVESSRLRACRQRQRPTFMLCRAVVLSNC